jgi:hypothetical protein
MKKEILRAPQDGWFEKDWLGKGKEGIFILRKKKWRITSKKYST